MDPSTALEGILLFRIEMLALWNGEREDTELPRVRTVYVDINITFAM